MNLSSVLRPAAFSVALGATAWAADESRTVWDGVFTAEQAARGQKAYEAECVRCHGKTLGGIDDAPALVDENFRKGWMGKTVGRLVDVTRRTMPPETAGTMTRQLTVDLVAFLLSSNGFPAGKTELETNATTLRQIAIEPKK